MTGFLKYFFFVTSNCYPWRENFILVIDDHYRWQKFALHCQLSLAILSIVINVTDNYWVGN